MKSICRTKLNIREREVAMVVGVLIVSRKDKLKEREWFIELPSKKISRESPSGLCKVLYQSFEKNGAMLRL